MVECERGDRGDHGAHVAGAPAGAPRDEAGHEGAERGRGPGDAVRDVAREIEDRGFPRGELVLANLRGRQLPVIAYAFAEFLRERLVALG